MLSMARLQQITELSLQADADGDQYPAWGIVRELLGYINDLENLLDENSIKLPLAGDDA